MEKEDNIYTSDLPMMTVAINTACNLHCAYCPPMGESHFVKPGNLELGIAREITQEAINQGVQVFRFTGGEPLLHPNFFQYLKLMGDIKSQGKKVFLNTNGVLLDNYIDKINKDTLYALRISLDTINPEKYHNIVGKKDTLNRVISNIKTASKKGIPIELLMVVMQYNQSDIESMIDFSVENGIKIKLCDMEQHPYDEQNIYGEQYMPFEKIHEDLRNRADEIVEINSGKEFGMPMTVYHIGEARIKLKDSINSATYNGYCENECDLFPCPEGVFSFVVKPDATITFCRRDPNTAIDIKEHGVKEAFELVKDSIVHTRRLEHKIKGLTVTGAKNHALLPIVNMPNTQNKPNNQLRWNYRGNQHEKYGRDRQTNI